MRLRVRYAKGGKIRFLSHRDLARVWERGLRRAGVRVAYSEGFSPRPRVSFGLALSTGHESLGEYLDIDLRDDEALTPEQLPDRVNPHLPPGLVAQVATALAPGAESLQSAVVATSWRIEAAGADGPGLSAAIERVLTADELPTTVERKGSETTIDARPAIVALAPIPAEDANPPGVHQLHPSAVFTAELATQPRSLRPAELVRVLDATWREGRVLRTHQWTLVDGARCEPIPLGASGARAATPTPHAGARAS